MSNPEDLMNDLRQTMAEIEALPFIGGQSYRPMLSIPALDALEEDMRRRNILPAAGLTLPDGSESTITLHDLERWRAQVERERRMEDLAWME